MGGSKSRDRFTIICLLFKQLIIKCFLFIERWRMFKLCGTGFPWEMRSMRVMSSAYLINFTSGAVNSKEPKKAAHKKGRRTEPWGKPDLMFIIGPIMLSNFTLCCRFVRNECSHERKPSLIPLSCISLMIRLWWILSNAFWRSMQVILTVYVSLSSIIMVTVSCISMSALEVEPSGRNACWWSPYSSMMSFLTWDKTSLSNTLPITGSNDIGRKSLTDGVFTFGKGVIIVVFQIAGNDFSRMDDRKIWWRTSQIRWALSRSNLHGSPSYPLAFLSLSLMSWRKTFSGVMSGFQSALSSVISSESSSELKFSENASDNDAGGLVGIGSSLKFCQSDARSSYRWSRIQVITHYHLSQSLSCSTDLLLCRFRPSLFLLDGCTLPSVADGKQSTCLRSLTSIQGSSMACRYWKLQRFVLVSLASHRWRCRKKQHIWRLMRSSSIQERSQRFEDSLGIWPCVNAGSHRRYTLEGKRVFPSF